MVFYCIVYYHIGAKKITNRVFTLDWFAIIKVLLLLMIQQVTEILKTEELESVIKIAFTHHPVAILRCIAQAGRSGVVWAHFELDGRRYASFLSWQDLMTAFWDWVERVNIVLRTLDLKEAWELKKALAQAIYAVVEPGDFVWDRVDNCWLEVIAKEETVSLGLPMFWVGMDDFLGKISPLNVMLL